MVVLHLLCVCYLLASTLVWGEIFLSRDRTASGAYVYAWHALPPVIAIYGLTL